MRNLSLKYYCIILSTQLFKIILHKLLRKINEDMEKIIKKIKEEGVPSDC